MGDDFENLEDFSGEDYNSSLLHEDDLDYIYAGYDLALLISFALSLILIVGAIVTNGLVCWVLLRKKRFLKSFANFHLLNLVLTDLIFRVLAAPLILTLQNSAPTFGSDTLCKVAAVANYTTLAVTFTLLAGIAFDRYVHIVFPLKARMLRWKHSRNVVFVTWIYAFACSASTIFSSKYEKIAAWNNTKQNGTGICISPAGSRLQISTTVFFVCAFLAPLLMMGFAYGSIIRILFKRAKSNLINSTIAKSKLNAVKMMMTVVLAYVISWGPKLTLTLMEAYGYFDFVHTVDDTDLEDEDHNKRVARHLIVLTSFDVLSLSSSVLNALLFGYYSPNFRQDLKKLCCKRNCCKKSKLLSSEPVKKTAKNSESQQQTDTHV